MLELSKDVCTILKVMNDTMNIIDKIKDHYYLLQLFGSDDAESVSPMISVQEKACRNPDHKATIPNEQGFSFFNAIKVKYNNHEQIREDAIKLLDQFDIGSMLPKTISDFKNELDKLIKMNKDYYVDRDLSQQQEEVCIKIFKKINDLLPSENISEEDINNETKNQMSLLNNLQHNLQMTDKTDPVFWHLVTDFQNKWNERVPLQLKNEQTGSDQSKIIVALMLDDEKIQTDPKNKDILEYMLKYLDAFSENVPKEVKKTDSVYVVQNKELKPGLFLSGCVVVYNSMSMIFRGMR